ncbi:hypothetical protein [Hymenobacter sp. APR13]|uniref:hypothetical protein n=1 Tax=Hymenobacter sp. APR13 TaxID=1356852 RepID=UPI0004E075B2|nr:hypothetical protein [Hymenobacter sp. APR13]AII52459.1 hypothetical protein N008_10785 [Hymenobacter sp. APR13]
MKQTLQNALGRTYISVEQDTANRWIAVDWMGYLTTDSIKAGARAYTEALASSGYQAVLNDTRNVLGPWDHSMDWVINEWAPNAAAAGLRYLAMISTPDSMADSSAATFYAQLKAFQTRIFDNETDAKAWLRQSLAALR